MRRSETLQLPPVENSPQVNIRSVVEQEGGAVIVAVEYGAVKESESVRVDHVDARSSCNRGAARILE